MAEMLRLSTEVHEKIIWHSFPNVTDEKVSQIIHNHPTANPLYYPEWWDEHRSMTMGDWRDLDSEYEELARDVIRSLDPIRLVIIDNLALFGNDDDEDLIDFRVDNCMDEHRRLIMRADNFYESDSDSEEDDIDDNLSLYDIPFAFLLN